jgi:hypothetical protein
MMFRVPGHFRQESLQKLERFNPQDSTGIVLANSG